MVLVGSSEDGGSAVASALTPAEAAAVCRVSLATVRRWVAAGDLAAIRLGPGERARIRIRREE